MSSMLDALGSKPTATDSNKLGRKREKGKKMQRGQKGRKKKVRKEGRSKERKELTPVAVSRKGTYHEVLFL